MDQLYAFSIRYKNVSINSKEVTLKLRGGTNDPKELAVQIMIMHHLMKQGFSFHPLIRPIHPLGQVQRHPIGRLRVRPQEFPIEPRLELPKIEPIGSYPAPSSRLVSTPNVQGYDPQGKPIRIIYRIKEYPSLVREAERIGKDQDAQRDVNDLLDKLALGNENPGIGTKPIGGGISELRGDHESRVYFRKLRKSKETIYEILGKSRKSYKFNNRMF